MERIIEWRDARFGGRHTGSGVRINDSVRRSEGTGGEGGDEGSGG